MTRERYDRLTPHYHLIFEDWDQSIVRQGEALTDIIRERWGAGVSTILDVACGIGTQAMALAQRGFEVTGSDLSRAEIERARAETQSRGLAISFSCVRHARLPCPPW